MAKVVAVQSRMESLSHFLAKRGYQVIDMMEASRPGIRVDAFLYTAYHPDIDTSYNNLTQTDDVTVGSEVSPQLESATFVMLNVTGMGHEEVASMLESRLQ